MATGYTSSLSDLTGPLNVLNGTITGKDLVSLGTLSVAGTTTLAAVTATTINATGDVTTGPLTSSTLTCTGAASTGSLTAATLTSSGTLAVTGASTFNGSVTLANSLTQSGSGQVSFTGAVSLGSTLAVTGTSTLNAPVTVAASLTQTGASNTVSIAGPATFSGALTQTAAGNAVNLAGPVSLSNTLSSTGAATFSSTVSTGPLTASSINTTGEVGTGALTATSISSSGTLSVTGNSTLSGATTLANTFTQTGTTNAVSFAGPTSISNQLTLGAQVNYPNSIIGSTAAPDATVAGNSVTFRNTDGTNTATRLSIGNSTATGLYDSRLLCYTFGTSPAISNNYERLEIGGNATGAFIQYTNSGTGTAKSLNVYGSTVFAPTGGVAFSGPVTATSSLTQSGGPVTIGGAASLGSTLNVTGLLTSSAGVAIAGSNTLNLGSDVTKQADAGKIGYQLSTVGAVDFYGAGTSAGSRNIKLWDNVIIPGIINPTSGATIGQVANAATSSTTSTTFKGSGVRVGPGFDTAGVSHTIPLGSVLGDNFSVMMIVFAGNKKTTGARTGLLILTINKCAGRTGTLSTVVSTSSNMTNLTSALNASSDVVVITDADCAVTHTQFIGS